jgi:hypothetical protein
MVRCTVSGERTQPHENAVSGLGFVRFDDKRPGGRYGRLVEKIRAVKVILPLWLACAVALFMRRPDLLVTPQLYAEDGVIFFREAAVNGVASLFMPYAGYHHLVARAIAVLALPFPAGVQPAMYTWTSVAIAAACCAALVPLLREVVPDAGLRAFAALGVAVAIPSNEIIGSVASLQWYLHLPMLAATLVALPPRAVTPARIAALIIGFTTPQGLIAAPIAAWLWWRKPLGRDRWTATLYAGASLLSVLTSQRDAASGPARHLAEAIGTVAAFRVGDSLAFGKTLAESLAATATGLGVALGLGVLAALLAALAWRRGAPFAGVFAFAIVGPVALVLATRPLTGADFSGYALFGADRYFVAPCAAAVVALAALAATIRIAVLARAAAVAALGYGAYANFHEPERLPDERWAAAAPALDAWRAERDAGALAPQAEALIPPATWKVVLPACAPGGHGGPFPRCPGAQ